MPANSIDVEVAVVGAGPVGLTVAVVLAQAGIPTALIGPRAHATQSRTIGLRLASVALLEKLGVWQNCRHHAVAVRGMRVVEQGARLPPVPDLNFFATEIG